jgi:hypothetical protein
MRAAVLGPAVAILVFAVGCSHDPVTRVEFGRAASRVCAHANGRHRITAQRSALADLRDLEAPKAERSEVEKWLAVVDQMLDEAELAEASTDGGDSFTAAEASQRATELDGRAVTLAHRLGVRDACRLPPALRSPN